MSLIRDNYTRYYLSVMTILTALSIWSTCCGKWLLIIISVLLMWTVSIVYLLNKEQLFKKCTAIVEKFEDGDFSEHLPKNQEGSFFSLLSCMDRFAMTLKSINETEKNNTELVSNRISDISHQLKTPLAALLMYNEIIEQEPDNVSVIQEFNKKSKNSLLRMQQLIQTLLVMTRFDAGSIKIEKEKYEIEQIVKEAVTDLLMRAQKEQKEIDISGNKEDMIFCDKKWTMEAISNIVKNSLDYTNEKGKIEISWETGNGVARIKIKDNGVGIKKEDICHIFKRFYRNTDNKNNGLGLGLSLAKSIIEEQGGTILLDSIYGEGTTMTISLLQEESY